MMGRTAGSRRAVSAVASLLGVLACFATALALGAAPALAAETPCPTKSGETAAEVTLRATTEQRRSESNVNPATGDPYSTELPDCRAYEMVSPLYKQAHGAGQATDYGTPVSANGETVGFGSEGDFSDPQNYKVNDFHAINFYLSHRGPSGWITSSAFAPRNLVDNPNQIGLDSDFSPDLRSKEVSCGASATVSGEGSAVDSAESCAVRTPEGSCYEPLPIPKSCWSNSLIPTLTGVPLGGELSAYLGASSNLSRVFVEPEAILPAEGTLPAAGLQPRYTMYELEGPGTESRKLRVVNLDNKGNLLLGNDLGTNEPPKLGDNSVLDSVNGGSSYHAISASGEKVFFAANANEDEEEPISKAVDANKGFQTLYARVHHSETVTISAPECTTPACTTLPEESMGALFQGASADGSKVFFTTTQPLVAGDTDETNDLYEYDFSKPLGARLTQISAGEANAEHPVAGAGAGVEGVVETSSDGSHVYFVATGVLTTEANANGEAAKPAESNLYAYDTLTGTTKFVATLSGVGDQALWSREDQQKRDAQTTPDGEYLVFSSFTNLPGTGNTNKAGAQAVYRYDFATGELIWISHAANGFTPTNEGKSAIIYPQARARGGAMASIDDWGRAISGEGEQEGESKGKHDGEYIIFTSPEKLQAGASGSLPLYEWHNGAVSYIAPEGGEVPAISASGSDIFFATELRLVGQDTDVLRDFYDARIDGGFPAPPITPTCAPESCQNETQNRTFGPASTSQSAPGGNLAAPSNNVLGVKVVTPKPLTRAQELAKALKACKTKPKKKRAGCESQARKKYGPKAKVEKKSTKAKKSARRAG